MNGKWYILLNFMLKKDRMDKDKCYNICCKKQIPQIKNTLYNIYKKLNENKT